MTVKQIIETWLKEHGYQGLCSPDCGCHIGQLCPCGQSGFLRCEPGYARDGGIFVDKPEGPEPTYGGQWVCSCGAFVIGNNQPCPACYEKNPNNSEN